MKRMFMAMMGLFLVTSLCVSAQALDPLSAYLEIDDPEQRLYFRTLIAPPDGDDMVYYWEGAVYLSIPGDVYAAPYPGAPGAYYTHGGGNGGTPLFGFQGYNIRNVVPYIDPATGLESETDFIMATREIVFYTNPNTGEVITEWTNPLTGKTTPVMPVLNEYLFTRYRVENGVLMNVMEINYPMGPGMCGKFEAAGPVGAPDTWAGQYNWYADIFPRYRLSDCGRYGITDPMNLPNGKYTSTEIFDFWVPTGQMDRMMPEDVLLDLLGEDYDSHWVPKTALTWVRVGPYLPWMCMDGNVFDGEVQYHVRSELLSEWDDIPQDMKDKMAAYVYPSGGLDYQGWQEAPQAFIPGYANDTTWSVFHERFLEPAGQTLEQWCASF